MVKRYAFSMIELVFAIVIIAIAVMSLPMVAQVTSKGIDENTRQEAIFAASTELMSALSGYWDERSLEDNTSVARVINISGDCNSTTHLRPGHIAQPQHRRCLDSNSSANLDQTINASVYSLDDAAHGFTDVFLNATPSKTGYKNAYKSSLSVSRSNNIKTLTVTIQDSSGDTITRLKAQSANIGGVEIYKKRILP